MSERCLFCEIAARKIPSQIVFENEKVIAFKDITPQAPVHIVIVSKEHITSVAAITDYRIVGEIFKAANQIVQDQKLMDRGFRIVVNLGPDAGQSVFHLHFHLLGGRKLDWPPG